MKFPVRVCVAAALLFGNGNVPVMAQAGKPIELPSKVLLHRTLPNGEITMEQFGDHMVIVSERGTSMDTPYRRLGLAAKSADKTLCAAQLFAYLSTDPVPDILFAKCPDRARAMSELELLRTEAKIIAILDKPVESRPGLCNNVGNDAEQFKDIECTAAILDLVNHPDYDDDHAYWCANTLRSSSLRIGPRRGMIPTPARCPATATRGSGCTSGMVPVIRG